MDHVLGVDIGGSRFRVGLFDDQGRRLLISEGDTNRSGGREWMLEQVRLRCQALLAESTRPVGACGVSFGGPVDYERQLVTSIHSPGWHGFPLAQWIQETLHLPGRMDNDANAGALGEFHFGAGRGTNSLVYITLSTGIGSGLILQRQIYRGKDSLAGELGHMPLSDAGPTCSCGGHGCLEAFSSGSAIGESARDLGRRHPEAVERIVELSGGEVEDITAKSVFAAAAEGNKAAVCVVRDAARWLARGLLTVVRILDPDKIILGGGVAQAGALLLDPVREFLREMASPTIGYSTEVVLAELGTLSPLYGAAAMALEIT